MKEQSPLPTNEKEMCDCHCRNNHEGSNIPGSDVRCKCLPNCEHCNPNFYRTETNQNIEKIKKLNEESESVCIGCNELIEDVIVLEINHEPAGHYFYICHNYKCERNGLLSNKLAYQGRIGVSYKEENKYEEK